MILQRRKWMIGLGLSAAGTLVLLATFVECLLHAWATFDISVVVLIFQGFGGLLMIAGGFAVMVAGTDESCPWNGGGRHCPHCDAGTAPSAGACQRCGHVLDE